MMKNIFSLLNKMSEESASNGKFNPMIFIDRTMAPHIEVRMITEEIYQGYQKWNRREIKRLQQISDLQPWEIDLVNRLCQELNDEKDFLHTKIQSGLRFSSIFNQILNLPNRDRNDDSTDDSDSHEDNEDNEDNEHLDDPNSDSRSDSDSSDLNTEFPDEDPPLSPMLEIAEDLTEHPLSPMLEIAEDLTEPPLIDQQ